MTSRKQILVLSLSPLTSDSRVLRQISVAAEFGDVTTVGYGPKPDAATEHIEVPTTLSSLPRTPLGVMGLALRRFRSVELAAPGVRFIIDALRGRSFDVVIANEARILSCAVQVANGAPVWADLHEYAPEERTHLTSWRVLVAPLMDYLCRQYLPRVAASTTVSDGIADLYAQNYGVRPKLMRNAAPFTDLEPSVMEPGSIRLVHSGAAVRGRNLEMMIDAVDQLPEHFTLDLYLVTGNDGGAYMKELQNRAGGSGRVTFHAAVAPADLPRTLNSYDVGIFWMPPIHTNARHTLPNKFYDYVQGRLALAIGPTEEMAKLVREHRLGVVSAGFELSDVVDTLASLSSATVREFKSNAHAAAGTLNFAQEAETEREILRELLDVS